MMWMAMVPLCNPFMDQDWSKMHHAHFDSGHHHSNSSKASSTANLAKSHSRRRSASLAPAKPLLLEENNNDPFEVRVDVSQFKLSDLKVRTVQDSVIVEGYLDDKGSDYGFRSSCFSRRYPLPKSVDPKAVVALLDKSHKVLTLRAKRRHSVSSNRSGGAESYSKRGSVVSVTKPENYNSANTSKETTPISAHSSFEA